MPRRLDSLASGSFDWNYRSIKQGGCVGAMVSAPTPHCPTLRGFSFLSVLTGHLFLSWDEGDPAMPIHCCLFLKFSSFLPCYIPKTGLKPPSSWLCLPSAGLQV